MDSFTRDIVRGQIPDPQSPIPNPARAILMERLTSENPDTLNRAMKETYDLDALGEAWKHWASQIEHARKMACALSARMDEIRGS
jgi:hypothetical protein